MNLSVTSTYTGGTRYVVVFGWHSFPKERVSERIELQTVDASMPQSAKESRLSLHRGTDKNVHAPQEQNLETLSVDRGAYLCRSVLEPIADLLNTSLEQVKPWVMLLQHLRYMRDTSKCSSGHHQESPDHTVSIFVFLHQAQLCELSLSHMSCVYLARPCRAGRVDGGEGVAGG